MNSRKILIGAGMLILAGSFFSGWWLLKKNKVQTDGAAKRAVVDVPVVEVMPKTIAETVDFTGRVVPEMQIELYAEVTGRLLPVTTAFKTGNRFEKGDTLIRIDDREYASQVRAARYRFSALLSAILPDIKLDFPRHYAAWNQYLDHFDAGKPLKPLPEVHDRQLRLFLNSNDINSQYHSIRQQEARLDKFSLEAPFTGVLTESFADPGALVQPSQRLGEFTRLDPVEIEAAVSVRPARNINIGDQVELQVEEPGHRLLEARIVRKNAKVDPSTQTVTVFARLSGSSLMPGAYVEGTIRGAIHHDAIRIAEESLVRNRDVFTVRDSLAVLQTVDILAQAGDSVIVRGLAPGTLLIDEFHQPSFAGTRVVPFKKRR